MSLCLCTSATVVYVCVCVSVEEVSPVVGISGVQEVQQEDSSRGYGVGDVCTVLWQCEDWCEDGDNDSVCESDAANDGWRCGT